MASLGLEPDPRCDSTKKAPPTWRGEFCQLRQANAIFKVIRSMLKRGQLEEREGRWIAYDDNAAPTDAFL